MSGKSIIMMVSVLSFYGLGFIFLVNRAFNTKGKEQ